MIYLFNDVKELTGTVRNNHILNLLYEREKNGIYSVSAEIPVTYNDQGTIYNYNKKIQKSDFLGHYDREGRFQLHKIAAVDIENGSIFVKGIHIFFDEAKAGAIIQDRRFVNREIIDGARVAFESIGWSVADFDVSVGKTYNFYNVTPLEARQILVETFGFEFDYWLDFDGKRVTNRHVAVKEKIGEKTSKRYTYGHNVLNIRAEQDYSEIYTAVIGRGKGEEIEETGGYGRRIEYTDVVWSTPSKPLNKPAGTRILEDPNATQLFGYKENGVVKPRIKVEVFSDIEEPSELIQASYEWLMDNNVPKAVFSLKVADGDGLNLGDEVYVIYRDIDLVKSARVEKVIDDLVSGNRDVEFGDTAYFDTDRRLSGLRADLKRYSGETGDRIYRLKMEFNRRFDEEVSSWVEEYEQALIDVHAEIEADRENMTNLIETERTEMETAFNESVRESKEYAEQQAIEKAAEVQSNLETATGTHQGMIESLQENVINIDDFLGNARDITLDERFQDVVLNFEDRIRNINVNDRNMLRGTQFDEPEIITLYGGSQIITSRNSIRIGQVGGNTTNTSSFRINESIRLEANTDYYFYIEYQSLTTDELDYMTVETEDGWVHLYDVETGQEGIVGLNNDGTWRRASMHIRPTQTIEGRLRFGSRWNQGTGGDWIEVKLPYLTNTNNKEWLPHPRDKTQSIEEVSRRITELEYGRRELITRSEYDFETEQITQTVKDIEETVDTSRQMIVDINNYDVIKNGSEVMQTVLGFEQKVWLNDVANIGANLIPRSSNAWEDGGLYTTGNPDNANTGNIRMIKSIPILEGESYTLSDYSGYYSRLNNIRVHVYKNGESVLYRNPTRGSAITFIANGDELRISLHPPGLPDWTNISTSQMEDLEHPIQIKLEKGSTATPMMNALSKVEQLADSYSVKVLEMDGEYVKQSELDITPDYWQLGSMRIGAEDVGTILRGSPDAIDMIADEINVTGNVNISGAVTALAVDAIEGNFARLFANQLTANVITSDHIQVGTALVDKMFATRARIDELITKTHFVNEMHALTLNVVDLNASQIRTRLLTANTIEAEWLKGGTALLDKVFASTAMFERMMAKSAFITTLSTVTLDLHELTIWRPDGVAFVQNGMERFGHPVPLTQYIDYDVTWDGRTYETQYRTAKTILIAPGEHAGRYYNLTVIAGGRFSNNWPSTEMEVIINVVNRPSGVSWGSSHRETFTVSRGSADTRVISFPLGRPTYGGFLFTIQFRKTGNSHDDDVVNLRTGRSWVSA